MISNSTEKIQMLGLLCISTACAVVDLRYNDRYKCLYVPLNCSLGRACRSQCEMGGGRFFFFFFLLHTKMDKHLKVLYIKVPSIHSPLHYEIIYNTTQVMSELQLMGISFGKKIRSEVVLEECEA